MIGGIGLKKRVTELGFTLNTPIRIIKSIGMGPVLVEVKGSRIAIGRGIAMKIMVRQI